MSRSRSLLLIALAVGMSACGGGDGSTEPPPPPPVSVSVSPSVSTVNAGGSAEFTATVSNATSSGVTWTASGGTIAGSGATVSWSAPGVGGSYTITATSVADATKSASATVTVSSVGLTLTPATITAGAGDTVPVSVSVTNSANQAVTWSVTAGTIIGSGASVQWAAPIGGGTYSITATSVLDPARRATAAATVTPVAVTVAATTPALLRGESTSLTAAVTGTTARGVTWSSTCGTLTGTGATVQYVAPATVGNCTIRATSTRDTSRGGSATITVRPVFRVAVFDDTNDGACTVQHCTLREAITAANAAVDRDSILITTMTPTTLTLGAALPFLSEDVDVVASGPAQFTIDAAATQAAQRGVLYATNSAEVSVRGMTLRGGRRNGGGGLVIDDSAIVTMRDVHVRDNESIGGVGGGVLALRGGQGTFADVEIINNRSAFGGGGMLVDVGSSVVMRRGRIADNESVGGNGGGVRVARGALTLDSLTISGNRAVGPQGGVGGGVLAETESRVQLNAVTLSENSSSLSAGGLGVRGASQATVVASTLRANRAVAGAGIEVGDAIVNLSATTLAENRASQRGGGVLLYSTARFTQDGGAIRDNTAGVLGGGGLFLQQDVELTLTSVTISGNRSDSTGHGGGLLSSGNSRVTMTGGSISNNRTVGGVGGAVVVSGGRPSAFNSVTMADNAAAIGGGAVFITANANVTITGGTYSGNSTTAGGGGAIYADNSTVTLQNSTLSGNRAPQGGGGGFIASLGGTYVLRNLTVQDNEANLGGGIGFTGAMTVTVDSGIVRRNRAVTVGGGVWKAGQSALTMSGTQILDNVAGSQGGGIQLVAPGAPATLRRLTVRGNSAETGSGGGATAGVTTLIEESTFADNITGAIGGGVFAASQGSATIRNSTFSGNRALVGGGVAATGPASLVNVTLVNNTASDYGAGIGTNNAGAMTVTNLVLSNNRVGELSLNCGRGGTSTITSSGGNVAADTSCSMFTHGTDKRNVNAGVSATLAANGGRTATHALLDGSAAINAGVVSACPTTDQRGFARVGVCDSGAFEFGASAALRSSMRAETASNACMTTATSSRARARCNLPR